jgi:PKD repeat protein
VYLDIHSYGELVLWPWAFSGTLPPVAPNGTAFKTIGRKLAYFNQYSPEQAGGNYHSDGISQDFAYGEMGVAALSFELGTEFFQACSVFEDTIFPDNLPSLIYAAKVARTPYLTPAGPDTLNPVIQPVVVAAGEAAQLAATIDDTRFNNQNGTEPTQNITAAEYYVDVPPWVTTGTPTPHSMTAVDGAFDETIEGIQAEIDTSGLTEGRHIVFVRGRDADGNWGAFSAVFLDVAIPPTAQFSSNTPVALGTAATFNNLSTGTMPRDYDWDFGDGIGTSVQSDPSYTYSSTGTFPVTLRVTNSVGSDSISHPVLVCRPVEITNLESDSPVSLGESAHFTATVSGDGPVTFTWDFGDGTTPQSGVGLQHTQHTYDASNTFDVTLDVTSACLFSDRSSLVVNVLGPHQLFLPIVAKFN